MHRDKCDNGRPWCIWYLSQGYVRNDEKLKALKENLKPKLDKTGVCVSFKQTMWGTCHWKIVLI